MYKRQNIYKIAAVTDRGQRLNKLISPMYEEKANEMDELIDALKDLSFEKSELQSLYLLTKLLLSCNFFIYF